MVIHLHLGEEGKIFHFLCLLSFSCIKVNLKERTSGKTAKSEWKIQP